MENENCKAIIAQLQAQLCREQEKLKIEDEQLVRENIAYLVTENNRLKAACNEAWNAFDNGKRKHYRDALSGRCVLGCQACAIEKLRKVLGESNNEHEREL